MKKNQIALKLEGTVDLDEFAKAISAFNDLVQALTKEVGSDEVVWTISELKYGSAYAEAQGFAPTFEPVERVVSAYRTVANAISGKEPIPYSTTVVEPARRLTNIIGEKIPALSMMAGEYLATYITQPIERLIKTEKLRALGVLTGQIETLQRRRSCFTLYDSLFNQGVQCYVEEDLMEQLRQAWGKEVSVTGVIIRDPETGRPLEMRDIIDIQLREEDQSDALRLAKGILAQYASPIPSEQRIQELRHAIH